MANARQKNVDQNIVEQRLSEQNAGQLLARKFGFFVGCGSHALAHSDHETTGQVLEDYARTFASIEFNYRLSQLPAPAFVHAVEGVRLLNPVWRITLCGFEEWDYFDREPWNYFIQSLEDPDRRNTLVIAFERSCPYDRIHLEKLLQLVEALYPLPLFLEFEHHSWVHAKAMLGAGNISVVRHDAPELPGIVKDLDLSGKRAMIRLLGREKRHWFEHHPSERFAYRYSTPELESIAARVAAMREKSDTVTIITATYPAGATLANATTLARLLLKRPC